MTMKAPPLEFFELGKIRWDTVKSHMGYHQSHYTLLNFMETSHHNMITREYEPNVSSFHLLSLNIISSNHFLVLSQKCLYLTSEEVLH